MRLSVDRLARVSHSGVRLLYPQYQAYVIRSQCITATLVRPARYNFLVLPYPLEHRLLELRVRLHRLS